MMLPKLIRNLCLCSTMVLPTWVMADGLLGKSEPELNLTLDVKGLRSDEGSITLQLFDSEAAFSDIKGDKALATYITRANEDGVRVTIHGIKKGVYAITLIHDENGNGSLDWSGQMPSEGYAYSRGAGKYSLPAFEDASITMLKRSRNISLDVVYH